MSTPPQLTIDGSIATITLNRPEKHNLLEVSDLPIFETHLQIIENNKEIRTLIITGTGEKSFCSGIDIGDITNTDWTVNPLEQLTNNLENLTVPTICALNGGVFGGASDLALACDFRIGVHGMRQFIPPAKLGVHYNIGGLKRFTAKLGPSMAKRMFIATEAFESDQLLEMGYLDQLVDRDDLRDTAEELANRIATLAPMAVQGMKKALNDISHNRLDEAETEARILACFKSEDAAEGVAAFKEKRKPVFKGQ